MEAKQRLPPKTKHLHSDVIDLLIDMSDALREMKTVESLSKAVHHIKPPNNASCTKAQYTLLRWTDTDTEARQLNHRRIHGEEISTFEYDELINKRKKKQLRDENIWTWDDWLADVKTKLANSNNTNSDNVPALYRCHLYRLGRNSYAKTC